MATSQGESPRKAQGMPAEDMKTMIPEQHMMQPSTSMMGIPAHKGAPANMPSRK